MAEVTQIQNLIVIPNSSPCLILYIKSHHYVSACACDCFRLTSSPRALSPAQGYFPLYLFMGLHPHLLPLYLPPCIKVSHLDCSSNRVTFQWQAHPYNLEIRQLVRPTLAIWVPAQPPLQLLSPASSPKASYSELVQFLVSSQTYQLSHPTAISTCLPH